MPMKKRYAVDIPAGIDNGQCKRLPGLGEPGTNGGARGDVLVEVVVLAEIAVHMFAIKVQTAGVMLALMVNKVQMVKIWERFIF